MTDKTRPRRELLSNIAKGAAIASGGLIANSTTAAASGWPWEETDFSVEDDVPGSYKLVDEPVKGPQRAPTEVGWTIQYSVPSQTGVVVELGSDHRSIKKERTLRGSGKFTVWSWRSGADDVTIRTPNTGWRRRVFGP